MIFKKINIKPIEQKVPYKLAKNQQILLMPFGDIHYDDKTNRNRLKTYLEWGLDRGAYFLGTGDYLDFTPESQQKAMYPLRDGTREFLDNAVLMKAQELLEILKPSIGHWIGMIEGNHTWDFSMGELAATSVDQYLCSVLKCSFFGSSGLIRLHSVNAPKNHPEADCLIYVHHGIGSSRTQGGHLHRVEDLLKWINADIYLMGHSHAKLAAPIDCQCISPDGTQYHRTKVIGRTGGFLEGYVAKEPLGLDEPVNLSRGSYIERKAYTPTSLGGLCFGIGYDEIHNSKYYRPTIHFSI